MRFKDRKASRPNRYKATPEEGSPFYVVLERADEPTEEGTPLNAAVLNAMASVSSLSPAMMDDGSNATGLDNSIDEEGYDTGSAVHAVLYTKQVLTEKQQAQARENIGITGSSGGSGIHIGTEAPTDDNVTVWIDTDEGAEETPTGKDGVGITNITITEV